MSTDDGVTHQQTTARECHDTVTEDESAKMKYAIRESD